MLELIRSVSFNGMKWGRFHQPSECATNSNISPREFARLVGVWSALVAVLLAGGLASRIFG